MLINKDYNIIFIHCNKCAGKSIEYLLFSYNKMAWSDHSNIKGLIKNHKTKELEQNIVFTIVRNPYYRIVSYVADADRAAKNLEIRLHNFKEGIEKYYNLFKEEKNIDSPVGYIRTYKSMLQADKNDNNLKYIDEVLFFENLNEDYRDFCNKYNIKENELPKINSSNIEKDYNNFYDNETKEKIYEMYRGDFEYFNYKKYKV